MPVIELFSKKKKTLEMGVIDVFTYDLLPIELKIQIQFIISDSFESIHKHLYDIEAEENYKFIHNTLLREYGWDKISNKSGSYKEAIFDFFQRTEDTDRAIDVIQLSFQVLDRVIRHTHSRKISADAAIAELNHRFKEHGIGYQFEAGMIIRIDSEHIHSEIIKPVLVLLHNKQYDVVNDSFLRAHEHYRHGRHQEALIAAYNSFESTLKIVCNENDWEYNPKDSSAKLIKVCIDNNLIPSFMESELTALRSLLESGLPPLRNKLAGHGPSTRQPEVNEHIASYALNMCAANIKFLIESSINLNNHKK